MITPLALEMLLHLSLNEGFDVPAEVQDDLIEAELVAFIPKDRRWIVTSTGRALIDRALGAPVKVDTPPTGWFDTMAGAGGALPDGFTPVASVPSRGKLPPGLNHDTHVQVFYRDGKFDKAAGTGKRVAVGEASLFNWKHAGPGTVIVNIDGKGESRQGMIGNPDDDIIGFRIVAPPENKMAMPKAVA